jgi:F-type H+-transporting ATPase subunit b
MLESLGINPTYLIGQIINFGILLFVLTKFLYKPILKILDARAKKIAEGIKAAEESIKEKEKMDSTKKEQMLQTRREVEKILAQAKQEAKSLKEQMIAQTGEEARAKAEKEYLKLHERLEKEETLLRQRVGKMTIDLTRKLLQKTLNITLQEKIFTTQLKKLKKIN